MDTSREDFGIAIRSAFLAKGSKQKFSLFALIVLSIVFLSVETIEKKPLKYFRAFVKIMLKIAYKKFWVPVMGRLLSRLIPFLEGKPPNSFPTYDIDGDQKIEKNN